MKYNININQKALARSGLNLKDSAILDYLVTYCNSQNPKIVKQRINGATWINYQSLMDDMPLLEISSRNSITPRIQKIAKAGYITTELKTIQGNKRLFVKLTAQVDSLFVESIEPVREKEKPVRETVLNNNTIYNNTKDYIYTLPEFLGKNYLDRIYQFYALIWKERYGFYPTRDFARFGKTVKSMHKIFNEYQIALFVLKHFDWHGATGKDEFIYNQLVNACFPFEWITKNIDAYKAYIINVDKVKFDDLEVCKELIEKYLKINK